MAPGQLTGRVKLLFDENLSLRLVQLLAPAFPLARHVDHVGLHGRLSFLHWAPPKVVWLSVGDAGTEAIAELLATSARRLRSFAADPEQSLLARTLDEGDSAE